MRGLHPVAAVGRDAQPVEPGVRRRRLVGRLRAPRSRRARRRWRAARTSAARSASRRRSTGSSASSRRTAACRSTRRSTSTPTATAGRWPARSPTARCTRTSIAGPDPSDITTLRPKLRAARARSTASRGCAIALSVDLGDWPVDPEVRANTLAVGDALRAAGAIVDEVDLHVPRADVAAARRRSTSALGVRRLDRRARSPSTATLHHRLRRRDGALVHGGRRRRHSFLEGLELEARLYAPVGALLEDYDALVCPTAGTRGLLADDDYVGHGLEVGGEQLDVLLRRACSRRCSTS